MIHTKKCNKCLEEKSTSSFYKDKNHSSGLYSICKKCKEAGSLKWRQLNREKYNATHSAYNRKHRRRIHLNNTYGMSLDEYNSLLIKQNMRCAICDKPNMSGKRPLVVDHNHKSGKVRGLLCYGCNRALGTLERPELLKRAMDYLLN